MLLDRSWEHVYKARSEGLKAYGGNALNADFVETLGLEETGMIWALTANDEVNTLACQVGRRLVGAGHVFQAIGEQSEQVAEHFTESAGELLFDEHFSVDIADRLISSERYEVTIIDRKNEQPLPDGMDPLFVIRSGRAVLVKDGQWPAEGKIVGIMPVKNLELA
jgi:hypothetical protein